jgi:hypothetical protein
MRMAVGHENDELVAVEFFMQQCPRPFMRWHRPSLSNQN